MRKRLDWIFNLQVNSTNSLSYSFGGKLGIIPNIDDIILWNWLSHWKGYCRLKMMISSSKVSYLCPFLSDLFKSQRIGISRVGIWYFLSFLDNMRMWYFNRNETWYIYLFHLRLDHNSLKFRVFLKYFFKRLFKM